jgi:hypothetical protein
MLLLGIKKGFSIFHLKALPGSKKCIVENYEVIISIEACLRARKNLYLVENLACRLTSCSVEEIKTGS